MDKLDAKQQAEVGKMSTERLRMRLAKAGFDEEQVATLSRNDLMSLYAEYLLTPPAGAEGGLAAKYSGMNAEELALRQKELELREKELDMKKAAKEKELALKEQELQRLKEKNEDDRKRKESMAGQTRFYGDALKHSLPKMGNDPSEFPSYFRAVENLFTLYEVPQQLQSKFLIPMLNERSKSLLAKLSKERLDKYEEVLRNYLLREFKLRPTPEQYRDRFWSAVKQPEETYTLFGSRAITLFQHYLDSRKVVSKDDVIDLLVADRIKQTTCRLLASCVKCRRFRLV